MQKIIGVTELQRRFRPFFEDVVRKRIPLVLTRGSRPEAVLISYEDYQRLQQLQENEVLANFDQVWAHALYAAPDAPPDEKDEYF